MTAIDPSLVAIISTLATLVGALSPKLIEWLTGRKKIQIDEAERLRNELNDRLDKQQAQLDGLAEELDIWKDRYYDLREKYGNILSSYRSMVAILRANNLGHLLDEATLEPIEAKPPKVEPVRVVPRRNKNKE